MKSIADDDVVLSRRYRVRCRHKFLGRRFSFLLRLRLQLGQPAGWRRDPPNVLRFIPQIGLRGASDNTGRVCMT